MTAVDSNREQGRDIGKMHEGWGGLSCWLLLWRLVALGVAVLFCLRCHVVPEAVIHVPHLYTMGSTMKQSI